MYSGMFASIPSENTYRLLFAGILVLSVGAIVIALLAEQFGLEPCLLCLYQRIPYAVVAALALAVLMFRPSRTWQHRLMLVSVGVFVCGAGLAAYQVGVENHWWAAPAGCGGQIPSADSVQDLFDAATPQRRPCDQDVWRLFGVSLAGWNILATLVMAAGCYASARVLFFRRRP